MKTSHSIVACAAFSLAAASALPAAAANIGLVYDGPAVANTAAPPNIQAFTDWCASSCTPTVQQPVYDTSTGKPRGNVYVWAKFPFVAGTIIPSSFCFTEFIVFALDQGDIYTHSADPNGTCGATMDPLLMPPKPGAGAVIAGGGDGVIVGGTGKFKKWTGTFTDRVFVGFGAGGVGGIIYYDQLLFSITGQ